MERPPAHSVSSRDVRRGRLRALGLPLALLCMLVLSACKAELYSGLTESEANEMLAILMSSGIATHMFRMPRPVGAGRYR